MTVAVLDALLGAVVLSLLALLVLAARRRVLQRGGGTVDLALRLRSDRHGRGWSSGIGRFAGDELQVYRVLSLSPRPRRVLSRRDLDVRVRREPTGAEAPALQAGSVVLECASGSGPLSLAVDRSAVTGLLAWLEAQPPGQQPA